MTRDQKKKDSKMMESRTSILSLAKSSTQRLNELKRASVTNIKKLKRWKCWRMIPPGIHRYFFSVNMKTPCISDVQMKVKCGDDGKKPTKLKVKKLDYEEIMGGGKGG